MLRSPAVTVLGSTTSDGARRLVEQFQLLQGHWRRRRRVSADRPESLDKRGQSPKEDRGWVSVRTVFETDARAERAQGWSRLHAVVTMRHRVLLRHRKVGCLMAARRRSLLRADSRRASAVRLR